MLSRTYCILDGKYLDQIKFQIVKQSRYVDLVEGGRYMSADAILFGSNIVLPGSRKVVATFGPKIMPHKGTIFGPN